MEALTPLTVVLALAFLCESMTEYLFSDLIVVLGGEKRHLKYIAVAVGVGLSLAYGLDMMRVFLDISPRLPYLGEVLTGLILGRGANYVHDFYTSFLVSGKRAAEIGQ
ncbi:MAG: hypothetical protein HYU86_08140 [Chloroflexi bacterium]|nr:hypothetical protein [Chloroflexota bacterium]